MMQMQSSGEENAGRPIISGPSTGSARAAGLDIIFGFIAFVCVLFVVLTATAMLLFPGGRQQDPTSTGYHFFLNFFSDLGATTTRSGADNLASMVLFMSALVSLATVLVLFFLAFTRFFNGIPLLLSQIGAVFGFVAAVGYVGVAATPWNRLLGAHNAFVQLAFGALFVTVMLNLIAILRTPDFPRRFAWVFLAFGALLFAYVLLIFFGPNPKFSNTGAAIQSTGQKIIVYASVLTMLIQSLSVESLLLRRE
jgi:hypothetical protein